MLNVSKQDLGPRKSGHRHLHHGRSWHLGCCCGPAQAQISEADRLLLAADAVPAVRRHRKQPRAWAAHLPAERVQPEKQAGNAPHVRRYAGTLRTYHRSTCLPFALSRLVIVLHTRCPAVRPPVGQGGDGPSFSPGCRPVSICPRFTPRHRAGHARPLTRVCYSTPFPVETYYNG